MIYDGRLNGTDGPAQTRSSRSLDLLAHLRSPPAQIRTSLFPTCSIRSSALPVLLPHPVVATPHKSLPPLNPSLPDRRDTHCSLKPPQDRRHTRAGHCRCSLSPSTTFMWPHRRQRAITATPVRQVGYSPLPPPSPIDLSLRLRRRPPPPPLDLRDTVVARGLWTLLLRWARRWWARVGAEHIPLLFLHVLFVVSLCCNDFFDVVIDDFECCNEILRLLQ